MLPDLAVDKRGSMSRIILFPSSYLPALGGVEELTRHLALALRDAGDEVEVWTMSARQWGRAEVEECDGMVVRRFPFPLPAANPRAVGRFLAQLPLSLWALTRAAAEFQPQVLHVQCFGPNGIYATALSLLSRVPLVVSLQGETVMDDHDAFDHSSSLRLGLRLGLSRAHVVTGCSGFTLRDAESRFGLARGRGEVIFNGVALDGTGNADGEGLGDQPKIVATENPYILALGRLVEKKGFDLLLRAFAAMEATESGVDLMIAGDGEKLAELQGLAADLGITGRVRFPGRLSREAVARAMAGARVFVMPSRLEPFGIVLLEAWRAGTPVVATARGGPPEFVQDRVDGILIDPFDTDSFSHALSALLSDPEGAKALGAAGRERVTEFAWPVIADRYQKLYPTSGDRLR
jgi:glycogen(starch) synthase